VGEYDKAEADRAKAEELGGKVEEPMPRPGEDEPQPELRPVEGVPDELPPEQSAQVQLRLLQNVLELYHLDMGDYPTTAQGLEALRQLPANLPNPAKWDGPYLNKPVPPDPWDRPYQYEYSQGDEHPKAWSLGPDGRDGTADDIGADWSTPRPPDTTLEALDAPTTIPDNGRQRYGREQGR
jgi:type II secretion system protein G